MAHCNGKLSMKTRLISTLLAAGSLPLLLASAPASATTQNTLQTTRYGGGSCHPTNTSNAEHARIDDQGRIFNTSPTQVLAVDCTLVRDVFQGKSAFVKMYVIDQKGQPGASLVCTFLMSNPLTGRVVNRSLFGTTDAPSSPTQGAIINSAVLPGGNIAVLNCNIPHAAADGTLQSGIGGYELIEAVN
jgi:hypothetical protein